MRRIPWIALALLLVFPASAGDGEQYEPPKDEATVELTTGYQGGDPDGDLFRVAEYEVVEAAPNVGLRYETSPFQLARGGFDLFYVNRNQFDGAVEFDLDRLVRASATATGFLHRLDNDPVSNLQAISDIKTVRSTDLDLGVDYQVRTRLYDIDAEVFSPGIPGLSVRAGIRELERKGHKQVLSTSHCTSCHTTAQGREVDQSQTDYHLGIHAVAGTVDFDFKVSGRRFDEGGATPTAFYEPARRPAPGGGSWVPAEDGSRGAPCVPGTPAADQPGCIPAGVPAPFDDRLWFQNVALPIDRVPGVERLAQQLKIRAGLGGSQALNFTAVQSTTENQDTLAEYDFVAYRGRYSVRFGRTMRLNIYLHHEELENDSLLVDLLALNGLASTPTDPSAGDRTYADYVNDVIAANRTVIGGVPVDFDSFIRLSSLDRTVDRFGADFAWRATRKGSLRVGAKYVRIDRDNVVLADGTGETTTTSVKLGWNQRVGRRFRWNNQVVWKDVDNPYANIDGALRLYVDPADLGATASAPSPKNFNSIQYFELHQLRAADVTNVPSGALRARTAVHGSMRNGKVVLGANVRYRDAENDELDYTVWEQDSLGIGANVAFVPSPKLQFSLGVDHFGQETDAEAIIPLFDG